MATKNPKTIKRKRRAKGEQSQEELRFVSEFLEPRRLVGESTTYDYEPESFKLGANRTFTPDFREILPNGHKIYYEVKGTTRTKKTKKAKPWMEADAAIKLDWFVDRYPELDIRVAFRDGQQWVIKPT